VPDANWQPRSAGAPPLRCAYGRRNVYTEAGVSVARSADVGADTVLGAGTSVGEFSLVRKSVVGRGVSVGMRACVDGCHLMDGCSIGDHVRANGALVCEGAVVHAGAVLEPGCVVSFGVVVGKGFRVPANARLSLLRQPEADAGADSDEELEYQSAGSASADASRNASTAVSAAAALDPAARDALRCCREGAALPQGRSPWDEAAVGVGGAGHAWGPRAADASYEWRFSVAPVHPSLAEAALCGGEQAGSDEEPHGRRRGASAACAGSPRAAGGAADEAEEAEEEGEEEEEEAHEQHFCREVSETFLRCVKDGFEKANAVVELQGLKMAENRSFADLARYILTTLLGLSLPPPPATAAEYASLYPQSPPAGKAALLQGLRPRLRAWAPLLRRFLKTEDDQVEMLLTFEEYAAEEAAFRGSGGAAFAAPGVFSAVLHLLYDADVLSEAAALAWAHEKKEADEHDRRFARQAQPFLEWLASAASESESESSESESSESESE
jgi:translation initiation factor eIF-2B subunit epsilon